MNINIKRVSNGYIVVIIEDSHPIAQYVPPKEFVVDESAGELIAKFIEDLEKLK